MINASHVKELREKTGAGMMDCKKALTETNGDFEAAIDWLRKKGLSNAAKKADRIAAEGLTAIKIVDNVGAVIEINSETDFVARNEKFQNLVKNIAELAVTYRNLEELKAAKLDDDTTVNEEIIENIATIGENLNLRRVGVIEVKEGVIGHYIHNTITSGLGKIAVIVGLESQANKEKLALLGKELAMHIAAAKPQTLNIESVDPAILEREKNIFFEQSRASGKPDNIIEKMVDGRIRKLYEEIVLLEQTFIIDGKTKISELIVNASKELGSPINITNFIRYELGEGIEQEEKNFAAEVAAVIKH